MEERYDYIICGAGCAGLSLAYYLSQRDLEGKRVLLLDKDAKDINDRTWSFWQKGKGDFEGIVKSQYSTIEFYNSQISRKLAIEPYSYKRIEGLDFYNFVKPILAQNTNIDFLQSEILEISEDNKEVRVFTKEKVFSGDQVFKSYLSKDFDFGDHHNVLQHFKGFEIETKEDVFKVNKAIFMDFRINQKDEVRFLYVLPSSKTRALVEVAIFSNEVLSDADYDKILIDYIEDQLEIKAYQVEQNEFGIIPMSTYPFEELNTSRIKHIGTAGGWVKPSSGYAFERIQKKTKALAEALIKEKSIDSILSSKNRYRFYDQIFLNVLLTGKASGDRVFGGLFDKISPQKIFKFLDEETNFLEEIGIFTGPPTMPFLKAFFEEIKS